MRCSIELNKHYNDASLGTIIVRGEQDGILLSTYIAALPYRNNLPNVSRLPDADYWLVPWHSPAHGPVLRIMSLPGLSAFTECRDPTRLVFDGKVCVDPLPRTFVLVFDGKIYVDPLPRTFVLLHSGNWPVTESECCMFPGEGFVTSRWTGPPSLQMRNQADCPVNHLIIPTTVDMEMHGVEHSKDALNAILTAVKEPIPMELKTL